LKLLAITSYYKPAYGYGGPVRCDSALLESLAQSGVDITVITTNANGPEKLNVPLLTPLEVGGVKVIYCPVKPVPGSDFYSPTQIKLAKQHILQNDIVDLQILWGYAARPISQYCKKHKIPYFSTLHGQLMDYAMHHAGWIKKLKKQLFLVLVGYGYLNGAQALHCTSELEIANLRAYPIHAPTFMVPNCMDVHSFQDLPTRGQLRSKYLIPEDALVIVMIGRIHSKKNPQIAVSALIAAQKMSMNAHLLIVGPDQQNLQPSLNKQASQAGCADRLHFTGLLQKDGLLQAMSDADLLIMPSASDSENFGMSAAECMAAGLPILVTENIPVGVWAKQAGAGETAPCNEVDFSNAVVVLLSKPAQLKAMGQNGKVAAAMHFDHKVVAKEIYNQLEQIIRSSQAAR
jgi:glycosyltransferase involved in cell wall biosynthesis